MNLFCGNCMVSHKTHYICYIFARTTHVLTLSKLQSTRTYSCLPFTPTHSSIFFPQPHRPCITISLKKEKKEKKEKMFTEYKTARNKVCFFFFKSCRKCKEIRDLWKITKIYHQFSALWTLSLKEPTPGRRKFRVISQLMRLMTRPTFCPLKKP